MKNTLRLVSTIIPTVGGNLKFLLDALHSALSQKYERQEIFVILDQEAAIERGNPNPFDTEEMKKLKTEHSDSLFFLINDQGGGASGTRNHGIKQAKGSHIAFLDDDDKWVCQNKLGLIMHAFEKNPKAIAIGSSYTEVYSDGGRVNVEKDSGAILKDKYPCIFPMLPSTSVVKKEKGDNIGWFNPAKNLGEDTYFFFQLMDAHWDGIFLNLPEFLVEYRIHENTCTSQQWSKQLKQSFLAACYFSIRRKRHHLLPLLVMKHSYRGLTGHPSYRREFKDLKKRIERIFVGL